MAELSPTPNKHQNYDCYLIFNNLRDGKFKNEAIQYGIGVRVLHTSTQLWEKLFLFHTFFELAKPGHLCHETLRIFRPCPDSFFSPSDACSISWLGAWDRQRAVFSAGL